MKFPISIKSNIANLFHAQPNNQGLQSTGKVSAKSAASQQDMMMGGDGLFARPLDASEWPVARPSANLGRTSSVGSNGSAGSWSLDLDFPTMAAHTLNVWGQDSDSESESDDIESAGLRAHARKLGNELAELSIDDEEGHDAALAKFHEVFDGTGAKGYKATHDAFVAAANMPMSEAKPTDSVTGPQAAIALEAPVAAKAAKPSRLSSARQAVSKLVPSLAHLKTYGAAAAGLTALSLGVTLLIQGLPSMNVIALATSAVLILTGLYLTGKGLYQVATANAQSSSKPQAPEEKLKAA